MATVAVVVVAVAAAETVVAAMVVVVVAVAAAVALKKVGKTGWCAHRLIDALVGVTAKAVKSRSGVGVLEDVIGDKVSMSSFKKLITADLSSMAVESIGRFLDVIFGSSISRIIRSNVKADIVLAVAHGVFFRNIKVLGAMRSIDECALRGLVRAAYAMVMAADPKTGNYSLGGADAVVPCEVSDLLAALGAQTAVMSGDLSHETQCALDDLVNLSRRQLPRVAKLPGEMAATGARFRNDRADYRCIEVAPQLAELAYTGTDLALPFRPHPSTAADLPLAAFRELDPGEAQSMLHIETPRSLDDDGYRLEGLLDLNFRLMRHDMLEPMRAGFVLAKEMQPSQLPLLANAAGRIRLRHSGRSSRSKSSKSPRKLKEQRHRLEEVLSNAPAFVRQSANDIIVLGHASVIHMGLDKRAGSTATIQFRVPDKALEKGTAAWPGLPSDDEKKRAWKTSLQAMKEWWGQSKTLSVGTLVTICDDAGNSFTGVVCFLTRPRGESRYDFDHERACGYVTIRGIGTKVVHSDLLVGDLVANSRRKRVGIAGMDDLIKYRRGTLTLIISAGDSFFAYEHVLNSLQRLGRDSLLTLDLRDVLTQSPRSRGPRLSIPNYIASLDRIDLSWVLTDAEKETMGDAYLSYDPHDPACFPSASLLAASSLDEAQVACIKLALTTRMSIIQGPPGTGKTYVGVRIVQLLRAILDRSPDDVSGPILCVCFTNHALDQFLEALLAVGMTKIARVGARSKSEALQELSLHNLRLRHNNDRGNRDYGRAMRKALDCVRSYDFDVSKLCNADLDSMVEVLYTEGDGQSHGSVDELVASLYNLSAGMELSEWARCAVWRERKRDVEAQIKFIESATMADGRERKKSQQELGLPAMSKNPAGGGAPSQPWLEEQVAAARAEQAEHLAALKRERADLVQKLMSRAAPTGEKVVLDELTSRDLQKLTQAERNAVVAAIRAHFAMEWREKLEMYEKGHANARKAMEEVEASRNREILLNMQVIGATTSGMAKYGASLTGIAKVVVCEEAAEVSEAHLFATLSKGVEHVVLIGDHFQLRPKVNSYQLQTESGRGHNLDVSTFERLISDPDAPLPSQELTVQWRMAPTIADTIRPLYEQNGINIADADRVHNYPPMRGFNTRLAFFDHSWPEAGAQNGTSSSKSNLAEAQMVVAVAGFLARQGYGQNEITILTPYVGQLQVIRSQLQKSKLRVIISDADVEELAALAESDDDNGEEDDSDAGSSSKSKGKSVTTAKLGSQIRVASVDNFQGEESDVVLVSLVRSNAGGNIGFLKWANRANVLLSRAKHGMILFGSASTFEASGSQFWAHDVLPMLDEASLLHPYLELVCPNHPDKVQRVASASDVAAASPEGGCNELCKTLMACGHVCPLRCHVQDREHWATRCLAQCQRVPRGCPDGHPCRKKCYQECGKCTEKVPVVVADCPAKHTVTVPCHKAASGTAKCTKKVKIKLERCGHLKATTFARRSRALRRAASLAATRDVTRSCETCLSPEYCRECIVGAGDGCAPAAHADDMVDMVMCTSLVEHDPDESPLILLSCGHALTVETLDGIVTSAVSGQVSGEETAAAMPRCPHCRARSVCGVDRYARYELKKARMTQKDGLHFRQAMATLSKKYCALVDADLSTAKAAKVRKQVSQLVTRCRPPQAKLGEAMARLRHDAVLSAADQALVADIQEMVSEDSRLVTRKALLESMVGMAELAELAHEARNVQTIRAKLQKSAAVVAAPSRAGASGRGDWAGIVADLETVVDGEVVEVELDSAVGRMIGNALTSCGMSAEAVVRIDSVHGQEVFDNGRKNLLAALTKRHRSKYRGKGKGKAAAAKKAAEKVIATRAYFHGTSQEAVRNIVDEGNDARLGRGGTFGRGIYTTPDPRKAISYSKGSGLLLVVAAHCGTEYLAPGPQRFDRPPKNHDYVHGRIRDGAASEIVFYDNGYVTPMYLVKVGGTDQVGFSTSVTTPAVDTMVAELVARTSVARRKHDSNAAQVEAFFKSEADPVASAEQRAAAMVGEVDNCVRRVLEEAMAVWADCGASLKTEVALHLGRVVLGCMAGVQSARPSGEQIHLWPEMEEAVADVLEALSKTTDAAARESAAVMESSITRMAAALKDGIFFQPLSDAEKESVRTALATLSAKGGWNSQGHFFKCPNGHIYVITECGGAMVQGACNECGATIGGASHRLRGDNAVASLDDL
ncbi:uncharacterized protein AMSG_09316 [Thecamonas trahens ATCC 50062]|uniref:RZ-type domain-containing protein n=1 Tax=Thecamonas trahens ATCC 50062 TaxID=461836 RepID=A0A0L0DL85_THETB|nr:hypothetical protein AMSG_09316 [Thecamonas trahens ATCC 50062]KNC53025.1 hypothetical protein AMSG_09316 [Thecamonas trahens ATCC 50062]|eukprot:XP_013754704.1 hypothetical protein AMSG_09316 [Thecamonas trahens ATCC 50062]